MEVVVTGNTKGGGRLGKAVFILSNTTVERGVGRPDVSYRQLADTATVRRRVNPRVVRYINTVSLPSNIHISTGRSCSR